MPEANVLRTANPNEYMSRSLDTMARHVRQMLELQTNSLLWSRHL